MLDQLMGNITKADLNRLVELQVSERRNLEYKETLPGGSEDARREFCYDVAALANSGGGDLIFGVREQRDPNNKPTGIPEAIVGLAADNLGAAELRLHQILQSSVDPRITGVAFQQIPGFALGPALIVRVPRSWAAPHAVGVNGSLRFYARHGQGKFLLDIDGIRDAFLHSATFAERARAFRQDRLVSLAGGESPVPLMGSALIVLHIVAAGADSDFLAPAANGREFRLLSLSGGGGPLRYNFDGVLFPSPTASGGHQGYLQVFRHGALETVDAGMLSDGRRLIPSSSFEERLERTASEYLDYLDRVSAEPPFAIMVSLIGVKGFRMGVGQEVWQSETITIDRDIIAIPEVVVESASVNVPDTLRPIFDVAWQASGFARSRNYTSEGVWSP